MVRQVRRIVQIKKVGHAGTLDPFASGLLVICAGRPATRIIHRLMEGDKEYLATMRLGVETDTQDPEGRVISQKAVPSLRDEEIDNCLLNFRGEILQAPPYFSAVKYKGKPLYHYARKGIEINKEPRRVSIHEIECLSRTAETLMIRVVCSKGTYIRTLAADIGRFLGCGAHLQELRRTRSGAFSVDGAIDGELLRQSAQGDMQPLLRHSFSVAEAMARLDDVGEPGDAGEARS
jgi:tRNA pseudouridine55 synthase